MRYIILSTVMLISGTHCLLAMEDSHVAQKASGKQETEITLICSDEQITISKSTFDNLRNISNVLKNSCSLQNNTSSKYHLQVVTAGDIELLLSIPGLDGVSFSIPKDFDVLKLACLLKMADALDSPILQKACIARLKQFDFFADFEKIQNHIDLFELNQNSEFEIVKLLMGDQDINSLNIKLIDILETFLNLPDSYIRLIKWSPDLTKVATVAANDDNTIHIWDATTGKLLTSLMGHTDPVATVRWNAKSSKLASCSSQSIIYLWDTNDGSQIRKDSGESWTLQDQGMSELSAKCNDLTTDLLIDFKQAIALKRIEQIIIDLF